MKLLLTIALCALVNLSFSQITATTSDGKKVILNKNGTWKYVTENNANDISVIATGVKVPITVAKLNALVGQYNSFQPWDEQDPNNGAIYEWKLKNGLIITGVGGYIKKPNLSDNINIIDFSSKTNNIIINCIFGLSLNKSSLNECKQMFGNLKNVQYSTNEYKFTKDKIYYYLTFDSNNILIKFGKADLEYDIAG